MFAARGCKVVGISDVSGGYVNPNGIDIAGATAYAQEHHSLDGYRGGKHVTGAAVLEFACDVLVPAALEKVLTAENAPRIKAKLIVEGGQRADHARSRSHLAAQRHRHHPRHHRQRRRRDRFILRVGPRPSGLVLERIGSRTNGWPKFCGRTFTSCATSRGARGIPYRTAAYLVAIDRVTRSITTRGVYA